MAFKDWVCDESISHMLKRHFSLEGNGGYKIVLEKIQKLDVGAKSIEETVPLLMKIIPQMIQNGQSRLRLQMEPNVSISPGQEYDLIMALIRDLFLNDFALFESISPFSFDTKPGALQFIFKHAHPRYPNSMCCGNYYGTPVHSGTIKLGGTKPPSGVGNGIKSKDDSNQDLIKPNSLQRNHPVNLPKKHQREQKGTVSKDQQPDQLRSGTMPGKNCMDQTHKGMKQTENAIRLEETSSSNTKHSPVQHTNDSEVSKDVLNNQATTLHNDALINFDLSSDSKDGNIFQRNSFGIPAQEEAQETIYEMLYQFGSIVALPAIGIGLWLYTMKR